MADVLGIIILRQFGPEECSLARKLCQRTKGHMLTIKIDNQIERPGYFVNKAGYSGQKFEHPNIGPDTLGLSLDTPEDRSDQLG